tara:strand:- start:971 stop:1255 length:285 start_codon:yes stop_codon:yes gene_type:complete
MSLNSGIDVNISDNHKYLTGDVVCIKSNHKIVSYVIEGVPLWRNWTDEGEYDYIYPVKDSENNTIHIREKRILRKIGSDINHLSELKSNSSSEL